MLLTCLLLQNYYNSKTKNNLQVNLMYSARKELQNWFICLLQKLNKKWLTLMKKSHFFVSPFFVTRNRTHTRTSQLVQMFNLLCVSNSSTSSTYLQQMLKPNSISGPSVQTKTTGKKCEIPKITSEWCA